MPDTSLSSSAKDILAAAQSLVTIAAILFGGVWAYFKYLRGRTYRPRLEPSVNGIIVRSDVANLAIISLSVKNVGLSRVLLDKPKSTLEVSGFSNADYRQEFHRALTRTLGVVNVLETHEWVEPGECIREDHLFALPTDNSQIIVVNFRLIQRSSAVRTSNVEWNAVGVLNENLLQERSCSLT